MSDNENAGSIWLKWDLHIHTPASCNAYGGNSSEIWERFICELEESNLDVIGINDYSLIDGYIKVLDYQKQGRLKNIKLILPVIEYRIDKYFNKKENNSGRINLHIICEDSIQNINKYVISIVNNDANDKKYYTNRKDFNSDKQDFNLTISYDKAIELAKDVNVGNKILFALGYNEWAELGDNAEFKKTIAKECDFLLSSNTKATYDKNQKYLEDKQYIIPLLNGSDKHNFNDNTGHCNDFSKYTWVKAETTFEGLKIALLEPSRIQVSDRSPYEINNKQFVIKDIFLENIVDYFNNDRVWFNEDLICIIGNKGAGKSLLAKLIYGSFNKDYKKEIKKQYSFLSNLDIETCINYKKEDTTKIIYYSQEEIGKLIYDDNSLDAFINKHIIESYTNLSEKENQTKNINKLDEYIEYIEDNNNIDDQLKIKQEELKNIEIQLTNIDNKLQEYNKAQGSQKFKEYQKNNDVILLKTNDISNLKKDLGYLGNIKTYIDNFKESIANFENNISEIKNKLSEGSINDSLDIEFNNNFESVIEKIESQKQAINQKIDSNNKEIDSITEKNKEILKELGVDFDNKYIEKLNQDKIENNNKQNTLTKEIDLLKSKEEQKIQYQEELKQKFCSNIQIQLNYNFEYYSSIKEKITSAIKEIKESSSLDNTITLELSKISFEISLKEDELIGYRDSLLVLINKNIHRDFEEKINNIINKIKEKFDQEQESYEDFFTEIDNISKECNNFKTNVTKKDFLYKLYNFPIKFHYGMYYDNVNFKSLSPGQRGTLAIIVLLLLDKNNKNFPLIIDQPEDNLDNKTINSILVPLFKYAKKNRQIILVTHNANLVINADAEQVIIANNIVNTAKDSYKYKFEYCWGSIENKSIKKQICEILEGGEDAFRKREKKYNMILNS